VIPDEVRKLLGGYATGTLTEEERSLLFSAALQDQELFDALADEEVLRELLAEPATRQTLLEQLQREPMPEARRSRAPLQLAAYAASPPPMPPRSLEPQMWDRFTPRRLALAGGLAALLLIVGGIQYKRLHAPESATVASVNLAMDRTAAVSVHDQVPAPRPVPRSAPPAKPTIPREAAPLVVEHAAVPSPAPAADSQQKAEKETADAGPARQQLNQAVREQAAREQAPQETVSAGDSAQRSPSGKVAGRRPAPISPSQIVTGGLSGGTARFAGQIHEIDAKVTDINGTIVSINAGSNVGLKTGDVVEIVRDNQVIATSKLSQVGATFAVGPLQRAAGSASTPQAGDTVRRAR
jgi:hypothetical protein